MRAQILQKEVSIVLIGDFNPKIFQPEWFFAEGLIDPAEREATVPDIIRPEVVLFRTDWLILQVTRDRFQAKTTAEPYFEVMRDLVTSTFNLLSHTPVTMLGINTEHIYKAESLEEWHSFGHALAPKEIWSDILDTPGLTTMTMEGQRTDGLDGFIHVKVGNVDKTPLGVGINVNDHIDLSGQTEKGNHGATAAVGTLADQWASSRSRATTIFETLVR